MCHVYAAYINFCLYVKLDFRYTLFLGRHFVKKFSTAIMIYPFIVWYIISSENPINKYSRQVSFRYDSSIDDLVRSVGYIPSNCIPQNKAEQLDQTKKTNFDQVRLLILNGLVLTANITFKRVSTILRISTKFQSKLIYSSMVSRRGEPHSFYF